MKKQISILHPYIKEKWGAIKMMLYIATILKQKWNDVVFYTFFHDKNIFSDDYPFEIKVWNKLKIARDIKNSDFIIIWNSPMQFVWVLSKKLFFSKAKLIWFHHHYPWYYSEKKGFSIFLKRNLEKFIVKDIDLMVWNSLYTKSILEKIYNKNKIEILYPLVDEIFSTTKIGKKDFSNLNILTYSRWVDGKNISQIFETFEYLRQNGIFANLFIGWVWEELDHYRQKYNSDPQIYFLNRLDNEEIISYLAKSNVFLFPSLIDSFWISVLEAMQMKVPVIAFDKAWVNEIIKNDVNWFLAKDSDDFNKKTYTLLSNKKLNIDFSNNCIETTKNFSKTSFLDKLDKILLELSN